MKIAVIQILFAKSFNQAFKSGFDLKEKKENDFPSLSAW